VKRTAAMVIDTHRYAQYILIRVYSRSFAANIYPESS